MTPLDLLRNEIERKTDLYSQPIANVVMINFFDCKEDIISDIIKHKLNPELIGKIMIERLNGEIKDAVAEAEYDNEHADPDESELNLRLFNRNEAR